MSNIDSKGTMDLRFGRIKRWAFGLAMAASLPFAGAVRAEEPHNWQIYFQESASPIMTQIREFNYWLQIVIALIAAFVLALLVIVITRFNARANPVPSRTSHNTAIEVLWTVVPVLILVGIAIPSFSLLFNQYDPGRVIADYDPATAVTIKATGNQWSWTYTYPDNGGIELYSNPIPDDALAPGQPRLLAADYPMVVPVNTVIRLQATSDPTGVIHAVAIPAFGVKLDAVPGRITEMWFLAEREGTFYGQCSELCGLNHYNMPIEVRVVSKEQFDQWAGTAVSDPDAANQLLVEWDNQRRAANQVAQN